MWEVRVCFVKLTSVSKTCGYSSSKFEYFHLRWHSDVGFCGMLVLLNLCSSFGTHQIELEDTEQLLKSKVCNCK